MGIKTENYKASTNFFATHHKKPNNKIYVTSFTNRFKRKRGHLAYLDLHRSLCSDQVYYKCYVSVYDLKQKIVTKAQHYNLNI